jgi:hypothetical protein
MVIKLVPGSVDGSDVSKGKFAVKMSVFDPLSKDPASKAGALPGFQATGISAKTIKFKRVLSPLGQYWSTLGIGLYFAILLFLSVKLLLNII